MEGDQLRGYPRPAQRDELAFNRENGHKKTSAKAGFFMAVSTAAVSSSGSVELAGILLRMVGLGKSAGHIECQQTPRERACSAG